MMAQAIIPSFCEMPYQISSTDFSEHLHGLWSVRELIISSKIYCRQRLLINSVLQFLSKEQISEESSSHKTMTWKSLLVCSLLLSEDLKK